MADKAMTDPVSNLNAFFKTAKPDKAKPMMGAFMPVYQPEIKARISPVDDNTPPSPNPIQNNTALNLLKRLYGL
jgi:hypothetical protein